MKKGLRHKLARRILKLAEFIHGEDEDFPRIQYIRHKKWFSAIRETDHHLDHLDLNEHSLVFDVGGYEGSWSEEILKRYNPSIFVFEPVKSYFENIQSKFRHDKKITTLNFGLSNKDSSLEVSITGDRTSTKKEINHSVKQLIELKSIVDFLEENEINRVSLIKLNIEGSEYEVLESLIASNKIHVFDQILVQFHDFTKDAHLRMAKIQAALANHYNLAFQFPFVWEKWIRKN